MKYPGFLRDTPPNLDKEVRLHRDKDNLYQFDKDNEYVLGHDDHRIYTLPLGHEITLNFDPQITTRAQNRVVYSGVVILHADS